MCARNVIWLLIESNPFLFLAVYLKELLLKMKGTTNLPVSNHWPRKDQSGAKSTRNDSGSIAGRTSTRATKDVIEESTISTRAEPNLTVIKLPYKIPTTEEKNRSSISKRSLSPTYRHSPLSSPHQRNNKLIAVKKFQPETTILSPEKHSFLHEQLSSPVISSALSNVPLPPPPSQTHVIIKASEEIHTRWPQKVIQKKDIENKPWYLLNFEETVELYCGDEIREEIYPKYNKSFVTKLKKSSSPPTSSPIINNNSLTGPDSSSLAYTGTKTAFGRSKLQTRSIEVTNNNKGKKSSNRSVASSTATSSPLTAQQKVVQSIKLKKLKLSELKKEIETTNNKIKQLQEISQNEHNKIQQIISNTELSNDNLNYLKLKITSLLNQTKLSIQELLNNNSNNQSYMNQLNQEIRDWEKDYFYKFNRHNIPLIEKKLLYEKNRLHLIFKIRRIFIVFSNLMKKHRYTTNWLYQEHTLHAAAVSYHAQNIHTNNIIMNDQKSNNLLRRQSSATTASVKSRSSVISHSHRHSQISFDDSGFDKTQQKIAVNTVLSPPPPPTSDNNSPFPSTPGTGTTVTPNRNSITFSKSLQGKINHRQSQSFM